MYFKTVYTLALKQSLQRYFGAKLFLSGYMIQTFGVGVSRSAVDFLDVGSASLAPKAKPEAETRHQRKLPIKKQTQTLKYYTLKPRSSKP